MEYDLTEPSLQLVYTWPEDFVTEVMGSESGPVKFVSSRRSCFEVMVSFFHTMQSPLPTIMWKVSCHKQQPSHTLRVSTVIILTKSSKASLLADLQESSHWGFTKLETVES